VAEGVVGLVLAAGAGRRFGAPKALARTPEGLSWLRRAVATLRDGGCGEVVVVLGAGAGEALDLVPPEARVVVATRWQAGQSASLEAGLDAVAASSAEAAVVTLVDLPGLRPEAVRRVADGAVAHSLRRATYDGVPGHPVLLGRDHWPALRMALRGDEGARDYLLGHGAAEVDCTDLGGGDDVDVPLGCGAK